MHEIRARRRSWLLATMGCVPYLLVTLLQLRDGLSLNLFESGTTVAGADALFRGHMLYSDHFGFYGPLAYVVQYAFAAGLPGNLGLLLVVVVIGLADCLLAYAVAATLTGRPYWSLAAPALLTAAGSATQRPLLALAAVLCVCRYEERGRVGWLVGAGAAAAGAVLWFQDAGVWTLTALGLAAAIVAALRLPSRPTARAAGWFTAGLSAVLLPWLAIAVVTGTLGDWLYYCFIFPNTVYAKRSAFGYVTGLMDSWHGLSALRLAYDYLFYIAPYAVVLALAAAGVLHNVLAIRRARDRFRYPLGALMLAFLALLQLRVVLASVDEAKLADSAAPTIVLGVTLVAGRLPHGWPERSRPRLGSLLLVGGIALLSLVSLQRLAHTLAHTSSSGGVHASGSPRMRGLPVGAVSSPSVSVAELSEVVRQVRLRSSARDPVFVAPTQPLLYFLTDRHNPTAYDYLDPVYTTADVDRRLQRELAARPPALVVLADNVFNGRTGQQLAPVSYRWIAANYVVDVTTQHFTLLSRRTR